MKLFDWRWLVAGSLLAGALAANGETRPQYGGTLRIAMHAAPTSLDPADSTQPDSYGRRSITSLLFDSLVTKDENGRAKAALADTWEAHGNQHWHFHLRSGVKFQDGSALTAEVAATSLRKANPSWDVTVEKDMLIIEGRTAGDELLAELALPRNAVAKRDGDKLSGTGPFHVMDWQPGKKLTLAAEENYWRGRPFLDTIEIEMGRSFREQMTALELGKANLVEVAPEQVHRISQGRYRVAGSPPDDLLALLFTHDVASPEEKLLREALGLSVERGSIRNVLLQGAGQPTASILPTWISGYGFVFSSEANLTKARQLRDQVRKIPTWNIGYDGSDSMARLVAERIALNAKDAGLSLQPTVSAVADLRLVRIPLVSSNPWIALEGVTAQAGLPAAKNQTGAVEDLYSAELALLASQRLVPLFHMPTSYASAVSLKNWALRMDGTWDLGDAWLEETKP
jgi:peptide/nickel transport system substrate-binding protein